MGIWNREAIEGFVVRTHLVDYPSWDATPYKPGSPLFLKVKFDEPPMMYRDWREITKKLLSAEGPIDHVSTPKNKMTRPETKVYVKWITAEIKRDKMQFKNKGHRGGRRSGDERCEEIRENLSSCLWPFQDVVCLPFFLFFFFSRRKLIF